MHSFRTELKLLPAARLHGLKTRFLTIGSCFSEAIGHRLKGVKFHAEVNPFGIVFNPISVHRLLGYSLEKTLPPPHTYLVHQDIFLNYDFHSRFSSLDKDDLAGLISKTIHQVHEELVRTDVLMITYGTGVVYELKGNAHAVANCHKRPAATFERRMLSQDEILTSFSDTYRKLKKLNPQLRIILTVSPVRHVKDTLQINSVSKSLLRLACHQMIGEFADLAYFPAYEIMMDDLRDYRFYKRDMIHPTEEAEDYIWERFTEHFLDEPAKDFIGRWSKIQSALKHKPFHENSFGHKNFLKEVLNKLQDVQSIVNVDAEIRTIQAQLDPNYHKNIDP